MATKSAPAKSAKMEAPESVGTPARKGKGKLIAIVLGGLIAAGGGGAAAWFMLGKDAKAEAAAEGGKAGKTKDGDAGKGAARYPATYLPLEPAFVVNLAGADADRYLQVQVQVMTRDPLAADAIKLHTPAIRDRLLLLFGTKTAEELAAREGRETLRLMALAEANKVMLEETGKDAVEALYFTSFVTQ